MKIKQLFSFFTKKYTPILLNRFEKEYCKQLFKELNMPREIHDGVPPEYESFHDPEQTCYFYKRDDEDLTDFWYWRKRGMQGYVAKQSILREYKKELD